MNICFLICSLCSILFCVESREGIRLDDDRDYSSVSLSNRGGQMIYDKDEVDNSWIKVRWSDGGYYYYNTLTGENMDESPYCATRNCGSDWNN